MVRFAVSQDVNKNNTSLMIMCDYTRRHVHVTSLEAIVWKREWDPKASKGM